MTFEYEGEAYPADDPEGRRLDAAVSEQERIAKWAEKPGVREMLMEDARLAARQEMEPKGRGLTSPGSPKRGRTS